MGAHAQVAWCKLCRRRSLQQSAMRMACMLAVSLCVWLAALTFAAPTPTLRSLDAELARLRVQLKQQTAVEAQQQALPRPTEGTAVPREATPIEEVVVQQHATIEAKHPMAKVTVTEKHHTHNAQSELRQQPVVSEQTVVEDEELEQSTKTAPTVGKAAVNGGASTAKTATDNKHFKLLMWAGAAGLGMFTMVLFALCSTMSWKCVFNVLAKIGRGFAESWKWITRSFQECAEATLSCLEETKVQGDNCWMGTKACVQKCLPCC